MMTYALISLKLFAVQLFFAADKPCTEGSGAGSFFGFPTWYKYLKSREVQLDGGTICSPHLTGLNDVWLIGLAVIEILLRIAILIAIVFVVVGGFKFITAGGNPDKIAGGRRTVIDALIGMVIAVAAVAVVSYLGGRFGG